MNMMTVEITVKTQIFLQMKGGATQARQKDNRCKKTGTILVKLR